jgi:hypothetical protein
MDAEGATFMVGLEEREGEEEEEGGEQADASLEPASGVRKVPSSQSIWAHQFRVEG